MTSLYSGLRSIRGGQKVLLLNLCLLPCFLRQICNYTSLLHVLSKNDKIEKYKMELWSFIFLVVYLKYVVKFVHVYDIIRLVKMFHRVLH